MSWLRIDDNMISHPKIRALTDPQFRVWMRCLSHASRMDDPTVDQSVINEIKGLSNPLVKRFSELRLLDETPHGYTIHDWEDYRKRDTTAAERKRRQRDKERDRNRDKGVTRARDVPDPTRNGLRTTTVSVNPLPPVARGERAGTGLTKLGETDIDWGARE